MSLGGAYARTLRHASLITLFISAFIGERRREMCSNGMAKGSHSFFPLSFLLFSIFSFHSDHEVYRNVYVEGRPPARNTFLEREKSRRR